MRVFLGSTNESVRLVYWASKFLKEQLGLDPVPWKSRTAFPPGIGTLEALEDLLNEVDGALIFVTADDLTEHRGATTFTPRDNIVFEAGLFLGVLGRLRTYLVVQRGVALRLPSDWAGITHESFQRTDEDPGISLADTLVAIADSLKALGPRGSAPREIRDLQQTNDVDRIDAAVGGVRRVLELAVYPRVGDPRAAQVDALVAYRFGEVAKRLGPNLQRKGFKLRLCLANMWDDTLADVYLRKYADRNRAHLKDAVRDSITVTLGKLSAWTEFPSPTAPSFAAESPPQAQVEIYLTPQRITHAYYRIDDLVCIVPLDIKKSADPDPCAWVFAKGQSDSTYKYYQQHFDTLITEGIPIYPRH